MTQMINNSPRKLTALRIFLRIYGVMTLTVMTLLFVGVAVQSPLLAEHGGALNWTIWNDVRSGHEHAHVPLMLFVVYIVWGVFMLRAAGNPQGYLSFLNFTMWANLAHGLLMVVQAATEMDRYWSKFITDIPFMLVLALGIFLLRPSVNAEGVSATAGDRTIARHDS
jgi:hypothetical protein